MSTSTARSVRTSPAVRPARPEPSRPPLRVVPSRPHRPARAPFVALVVTLLGGGLVGLLLLNTALAEGSFRVYDLKVENAALADREQQLGEEVARLSTPQVLSARARELGMVQSGSPAFVNPRSGEVRGEPAPAKPGPRPAGEPASGSPTGSTSGSVTEEAPATGGTP
ncbi:MAG: FtsB family cell division protein [Actinomycetes bacterium]